MPLFLLILAGLVGWGLLFYRLDRPSVPAYRVRDAYRLVTLLLFVLLLCAGYKAAVYRTELRVMNRICR